MLFLFAEFSKILKTPKTLIFPDIYSQGVPPYICNRFIGYFVNLNMIKKLVKFLLKFILWFFIMTIAWVFLYKFIPVPYTPLMAIRTIESDQDFEIKHQWKSIDNIAPSLQLAVICAEDQNFMSHKGFDYEAIKKAREINKTGKKLRGASTISQQTAKNVFLWPARSWFRKAMEAYFTFLIETLWSKERILEVYLNSIEMGNGIFGAQAASEYWFSKSADSLTSQNAAAIAAILPNPRNYRAEPPTPYISGRIKWILRQMQNYGPLDLKK